MAGRDADSTQCSRPRPQRGVRSRGDLLENSLRWRERGSLGYEKTMDQKPDEIQDDVARREGIRRVLVGQYMFHEAWHHPEFIGETRGHAPTLPKAHTVADIYKCLHQGEFGVGHSIEDPGRFAHALVQELLSAEENFTDPVLESVSADGSVFRVNLRPYRRIFANREESGTHLLVEACLNSAKTHKGSREKFITSLGSFRHLNANGELVVQNRQYLFPDELVALFLIQVRDFMQASGNPPVLSHSPVYRNYNAPSYRVVDRATLERSALTFLFQELQ
jgi:hypothetical protein